MAASDAEHEHEVSGTSETSDTSLRPPQSPPANRGCLGRWVMGAAAVTAVTVVVAALAVGLSAASGGTPGTWQTYRDPFGLFTLRLPPGWTAVVESGTGGFGDSQGGVTEREDWVSFGDPTQGTGSAHVWVFATPLQTALAHQTFCRGVNTPLQSFAPLTLRSMEPGGIWSFTTENATFQIDVAIPSVVTPVGYGPPPPPVTPIPSTWLATDTSEVNTMLVSFQPTDPKPLTC